MVMGTGSASTAPGSLRVPPALPSSPVQSSGRSRVSSTLTLWPLLCSGNERWQAGGDPATAGICTHCARGPTQMCRLLSSLLSSSRHRSLFSQRAQITLFLRRAPPVSRPAGWIAHRTCSALEEIKMGEGWEHSAAEPRKCLCFHKTKAKRDTPGESSRMPGPGEPGRPPRGASSKLLLTGPLRACQFGELQAPGFEPSQEVARGGGEEGFSLEAHRCDFTITELRGCAVKLNS